MSDNFQDNVSFISGSLHVSGDAIIISGGTIRLKVLFLAITIFYIVWHKTKI
jgi:hypothetical protein